MQISKHLNLASRFEPASALGIKTKSQTRKSETPGELSGPDLLGERLCLVVTLRESENKTFQEIGSAIGCVSQYVWQLYHKAKQIQERHKKGDPYSGLSTRAANCCKNLDLRNREQIAAAIKNGTLHPRALVGCRNYGWKTHKEIHQWLGLPKPVTAPVKSYDARMRW